MKVVTFNIRYDCGEDGINNFTNRRGKIADRIRQEAPDVICFQEVLTHVAEWLKCALEGYYVIGAGREPGYCGEQAAIAYRRDLYNLLDFEVFWLSATPQEPSSRYPGQSDCPRICSAAVFQVTCTDKLFRVYNTHLDHISAFARKRGLELILAEMGKHPRFCGVPAILAGDFNAEPDSAELSAITGHPEFFEATKAIDGTFHDFGRNRMPEKIDYIFATRAFGAGTVRLWDESDGGVYLSDHYPVCTELILS